MECAKSGTRNPKKERRIYSILGGIHCICTVFVLQAGLGNDYGAQHLARLGTYRDTVQQGQVGTIGTTRSSRAATHTYQYIVILTKYQAMISKRLE